MSRLALRRGSHGSPPTDDFAAIGEVYAATSLKRRWEMGEICVNKLRYPALNNS